MTESLENRIRSAARSVEPSNDFTDNLWNQIKNTHRTIRAPQKFKRWLWVPASAVLVAALVLILITPQGVMAAIRNMLAYLPGVGFVQNDKSTLYLKEPVTAEQDGVTLIIEQVVADADKTVVVYHVDGLPTPETGTSPCFYDGNQLLLPDGSTRLPTGGGVEGSQARVEFFPLPEGVTQATLLASMNIPDPACSVPQEWKVEFSLGTIPPEDEMVPVYSETTTIALPENPTDVSMDEIAENAVQLVIDQVAVLEDGYLLFGHCEWTDEDWQNVRIDEASAYALDAAGNHVPLELSEEGSEDNAFAFKVSSKGFVAPLTLHAENLLVWANGGDAYRFTFDAGSDPQIGQSWDINKELEIEGQKIIINNVTVVEQSDVLEGVGQAMGYAIEVDIPDDFNGFFWCKGQGESSSSWGQVRVVENRTIMESYSDALPYGKVTCDLQNVQFQLPGSWQVKWQPSPDMQ